MARVVLACLVLVLVLACRAAVSAELQNVEYAIEKDVFYLPEAEGTAADYAKQQCRLDLYYPKGAKGYPTVVFYHGGGLTAGKRSLPGELQKRGWEVVGVGYRLSPQVQHPVYIEDAAAALAWTFKQIEAYGGDPAKIFVTGIMLEYSSSRRQPGSAWAATGAGSTSRTPPSLRATMAPPGGTITKS